MAKILITGSQKAQTSRLHHKNQQLKVVPSYYSLYNCLHDMGHEVIQKQIEFGEDLSTYDRIVVYLSSPVAFHNVEIFNALWVISQRPDAIIGIDDWQFETVFKSFITLSDPEFLKTRKSFFVGSGFITDVDFEERFDDIVAGIKWICEFDKPMLISAFDSSHVEEPGYGVHGLFKDITYDHDKIFVYNPNPYHRNRTLDNLDHVGPEAPEHRPTMFEMDTLIAKKVRRFNFASLVQGRTISWLKKQGFKASTPTGEEGFIGDWPIELFGSKKHTDKRLTEDAMCLRFAEDWGTLLPEYDSSKSGWWRARPLQAADAGSILIGDPKELKIYYGKDYPYYHLKAIDITKLSDQELAEIAALQKKLIYEFHPLDKKVQQRELEVALCLS